MCAVIKSGVSTDQLTVGAVSKAAYVELRDSTGGIVTIPENKNRTVAISLSALNETVDMPMDGQNGVGFDILVIGDPGNVIVAEQTMNGYWIGCTIINNATNNSVSTISATGSYTIRFSGGVSQVRLRVSNYVAGTITGEMNASYAMSQNVEIRAFNNVLSTANSTSVQLAAGATFTGAWEEDLSWQGSMFNAHADQDLTIVFEQSKDGITAHNQSTHIYRANSTNYDSAKLFPLVSNYHRIQITNNGSATTTTLNVSTYNTPNFVPVNGLSLTQRGSQPVEVPVVSTYRAALAGITPVATLTFSIKGSATKTIKITKLGYSMTSSNSNYVDMTVKKYSAVTGGTGVTITDTPLDSNFVAATALVQHWTTTPATQTAIGALDAKRLTVPKAADNVAVQWYDTIFGDSQRGTSAIVLRGTSQWVGIDLSAVSGTVVADVYVEWTEE